MEKRHEETERGLFSLRRVREADAAAIAEIYNHYVVETTVSFETEPLSTADMLCRIKEIAALFPYFVATREDKVVGYCYAHPWKEGAAYCHTLEVTIYTDPEYRRTGMGTMMMGKLIEACRETGNCHALIACITEENHDSIAFHRRMGFEKVSSFKDVGYKFGRWLDVTDMEMVLG